MILICSRYAGTQDHPTDVGGGIGAPTLPGDACSAGASRDLFRERFQQGLDMHMHEMIYPVLQGYDSVALQSDLTIIGSDQLFNEMLGRFYQERLGQPPQVDYHHEDYARHRWQSQAEQEPGETILV